MIQKYSYQDLGKANYGWLQTSYHFSFASYYNPMKVRLGSLRVINDDYIGPHSGFETHPHNDMEILTYVVDGELTHQDSMRNSKVVSKYGVQYMSAGTGVYHSEHNNGDKPLHLYQIWILPDKKGYAPNYGDFHFNPKEIDNAVLELASHKSRNGVIKINQNASISVGKFNRETFFKIDKEDYDFIYLIQIEGESKAEEIELAQGDAVSTDQSITLHFTTDSHILYVRVKE